jgi:hypothetical protein
MMEAMMSQYDGDGERAQEIGQLVILSEVRAVLRPPVGPVDGVERGRSERHRVVIYDWHEKRRRSMEVVLGEYNVLAAAQAFVQCWELAGSRNVTECLACGHPFQSAGVHNRVCSACKDDDDLLPPDLAGGFFCR